MARMAASSGGVTAPVPARPWCGTSTRGRTTRARSRSSTSTARCTSAPPMAPMASSCGGATAPVRGRLVRNINPAAGERYPGDLTNIGGTLYFSAIDGTNGAELWKSNGTSTGTVRVRNIGPARQRLRAGSNERQRHVVTSCQRRHDGSELWKSDGTSTGTVLLRNINPARTSVIRSS